jgi:sulfur-oxidizing protein SoxX
MNDMQVKLYLMSILMVPVYASAQANSNIETGFDIMTNKLSGNCLACHDLPGVSGVPSNFGPSLRGVGARRSQDELLQWVVDARKINPETLMPPFGSSEGLSKVIQKRNLLSSTQIEKVVSTLQSWRQ